jgi:hypothetical protein
MLIWEQGYINTHLKVINEVLHRIEGPRQ